MILELMSLMFRIEAQEKRSWAIKDFTRIYHKFFSTTLLYSFSSLATRDFLYQELTQKHQISNFFAAALSGFVGAAISLPFFKGHLLNNSHGFYTLSAEK